MCCFSISMAIKRTQKSLLLTTIMLLFPVTAILADDYQMSALDITLELTDDGLMEVREDRTFSFDGSFSYVYRTFPLDGKAAFSDFRVFEGDREYRRSNSEEPGTMSIKKNNDEVELRLFFEAEDTTRTFRIAFTAEGAMEGYQDAALLYYQLISDQWDKPIHDITARIIPPESLPTGEPAHWVHGSLDAISEIQEGGVINITLDRLPAKHYLEIRALYPPDYFPGLDKQDEHIREKVQAEAAGLTEEANRLRREAREEEAEKAARHATGKMLAFPLTVILIGLWIWLYRKYGRRPVLEEKPGAFTSLPAKEKPALVNYLMSSGNVTGNALVSTLFHLAYNGFLTIEEKESGRKNVFGFKKRPVIHFRLNHDYYKKHQEALLPYERQLITFLFEELDKPTSEVSLKLMEKKSTKMQKFFSRWRKAVKKEAVKKEWFDKRSQRGQTIGLVGGIVFMLVFVVLLIFYGPWMLVPLIASFFFMLGSLFIFHRTEEGEKASRQWKSLKQYLRRFHFESDSDKLDSSTVNEYLIYGLALGLGPRYFKALSDGLEHTGNTGFMAWLVIHQSNKGSVGKAINDVVSTTSSVMSSASGAGGGGTAGGGGGASSGGGGAG